MIKDLGFFVTLLQLDRADESSRQSLINDDITITTKNFLIGIKCFANVEIYQDASHEITIILYGKILGGAGISDLVELYKTQGILFVESLNGSFVVLLVDKPQDKILFATDRLSSRKLYIYKKESAIFVSTMLKHLFTDDLSLDPAGVAWYLSNGVVHNNRTIFTDIFSLARASCLLINADKSDEVQQYWQYQFTNEYAHKDIKQVKDEFTELLIDSVKKRVDKDSPLFLSLSCGYDSTGILGILSEKLHVEKLTAFSYGLSETNEMSDPYLARRLAEMCGTTHRFLLSYDGNFCDAIERNALWGDGLSYFCDESLVWSGFNDSPEYQNVPLFVGDHCFGWKDTGQSNIKDVLASCPIWDFNVLSWLKGFISHKVYNEFSEGLDQDISAIINRAPHTKDLHDIKDYIYLDQINSNMYLQWREKYHSRIFDVKNPFLDNAIIDFVRMLPSKLRRDKNLYKEVISSMFPPLFTVNRAPLQGYIPDWKAEMRKDMDSIVANFFQSGNPSKLDDFINPNSVLRLFTVEDEIHYKILIYSNAYVKRALQKVHQKKTYRNPPGKPNPMVFLLRYLVLKRFLEIAKDESLLNKRLVRSSQN